MTDESYVCTVCGDRCVIKRTDPPPHCLPNLRRIANRTTTATAEPEMRR